jgi:hypothetical protein
VGASRRPATDDIVVFAEEQIDDESEIGKSSAEVVCNLLLPLRPRQSLRGAEVVPDVVAGEDFEREVGVAPRSHTSS